MTKDKLYEISKKLYREKSGLENHLSRCTNDLFKLEDKIILYDLTNTYFEGRMKDSRMAKFGRSKEKRSDARLKYNTIPMARKKSVWHTDEILKNIKSDNQLVMDG